MCCSSHLDLLGRQGSKLLSVSTWWKIMQNRLFRFRNSGKRLLKWRGFRVETGKFPQQRNSMEALMTTQVSTLAFANSHHLWDKRNQWKRLSRHSLVLPESCPKRQPTTRTHIQLATVKSSRRLSSPGEWSAHCINDDFVVMLKGGQQIPATCLAFELQAVTKPSCHVGWIQHYVEKGAKQSNTLRMKLNQVFTLIICRQSEDH